MRLLVCGSRDFENERLIETLIFDHYTTSSDELTLIEGGATGADAIAASYAERFIESVKERNQRLYLRHEQYPADWETHGKAAGPIRNKQMLDEGKPDKVLAFINKPLVESRGTKNMVEISEKAGLPVIIVETRNM